MSSALVGHDCRGLLPVRLACKQWQCLRGMTTHSKAINLAKRALFVLYHERQTLVFVLLHPYLAIHELKFLLPLRHILVKFVCAPLPLWPNTCVWVCGASPACESLNFDHAPWFLQPNTWFGFAAVCWSCMNPLLLFVLHSSPGLYLSGRLGCPSKAHFHVPKPNTQYWSWCPRDISQSGSHWHSLFWGITHIHFFCMMGVILDKTSRNIQLLHPILFILKKSFKRPSGTNEICEISYYSFSLSAGDFCDAWWCILSSLGHES